MREHLRDPAKVAEILAPIVEARRREPQDDLISVLTRGGAHRRRRRPTASATRRSTPSPTCCWPPVRARPGSRWGSPSRRCCAGRTSSTPSAPTAACCGRRSRSPSAGSPPIPCSPDGWPRTPSCAARPSPRGRSCTSAWVRPTATPNVGTDPDEYDPGRPLKPSLGFGGGPHICLGMHVARAEMSVGIGALLDRLPNLRLDPDAEPPRGHRVLRAGRHGDPGGVRLMGDTPEPRLLPARRRARPPLPRDRRRGGLRVERRADPAAHDDGPTQRRGPDRPADLRP